MGLLTNLALFAGVGGLELGARRVGGFKTVCYVERDPYAQAVLMSRMRDGSLDDAPIWDDVTTFDGRPWRGLVDVVSGGFPCQDISSSGAKEGTNGARSGLYIEFIRLLREISPRFALMENVSDLLYRGMGDVLSGLAEVGYDAEWNVIPACFVGLPQARERVWIVAYPCGRGRDRSQERNIEGPRFKLRNDDDRLALGQHRAREATSRIRRMDDGMDFGVDRLRCCGNGVVPEQSIPAWQTIKEIAGA